MTTQHTKTLALNAMHASMQQYLHTDRAKDFRLIPGDIERVIAEDPEFLNELLDVVRRCLESQTERWKNRIYKS